MLTIGQLASATGVATSAVRYYERQGLLEPAARSNSNYRLYSQDAVDTLQFIKTAKKAGFTLPDIRQLLSVRAGLPDKCDAVQSLLEKRLRTVDGQLQRFAALRERLVALQLLCGQTGDGKECGALRRLSAQSRGGVTRRPENFS